MEEIKAYKVEDKVFESKRNALNYELEQLLLTILENEWYHGIEPSNVLTIIKDNLNEFKKLLEKK